MGSKYDRIYKMLSRHGISDNDILMPHQTTTKPIYDKDAIWSKAYPDTNYALYFSETIEACKDFELAIDIIGYYPEDDLFLVKRQ